MSDRERQQRLRRTILRPITHRTVTDPGRLTEILREVAASGYAMVDDELEEGLRSIAVPVCDASGAVVAAVNVSTHTGRGSADQTRSRLLDPLRRAAAAIEADLRAVSARAPLRLPDPPANSRPGRERSGTLTW